MTVDSGSFGDVACGQATEDSRCQAARMAGPFVVGGMGGDRDKSRPLCVEPGQRCGRVRDGRQGTGGRGKRWLVRVGGKQGAGRRGGGSKEVVEQAGQRRSPFFLPVLVPHLIRGGGGGAGGGGGP